MPLSTSVSLVPLKYKALPSKATIRFTQQRTWNVGYDSEVNGILKAGLTILTNCNQNVHKMFKECWLRKSVPEKRGDSQSIL